MSESKPLVGESSVDVLALAVLTLAFARMWIHLDTPSVFGRPAWQPRIAFAAFVGCLAGTIVAGLAA